MSPQFLKLLEFLGRLGVRFDAQNVDFTIGAPDALDSRRDSDWRRYLSSRFLWGIWAPVPGSRWEPFHCVTLFAAVDELKKDSPRSTLAPVAPDGLPDFIMNAAPVPPWVANDTLVMVDLPGPQSVGVAAQLILEGGCQPVCTFDNWPHKLGVIRSERVLAALLYYAGAVYEKRSRLKPDAPPVWICDRERFTGSRPPPGRFDNRYIIEDRLLPGPHLLRAAGIRKVVYVGPARSTRPAEDVRAHLDELIPLGIGIQMASIATPAEWMNPWDYVRPLGTRSGWSIQSMSFMRSSAGGFGGFVPQPSSGGG